MDPQQLIQFIIDQKWWAAVALVIGFVVRLIKSDTKLPINIPPQYRIWLAMGLGVVAGVCNKIASGTSWKDSLVWGLSAAIAAVLAHEGLIESARGGKELSIPGLMIKPPANDNQPPPEKKEAA